MALQCEVGEEDRLWRTPEDENKFLWSNVECDFKEPQVIADANPWNQEGINTLVGMYISWGME